MPAQPFPAFMLSLAALSAHASDAGWAPDQVFMQVGAARDAHTAVIGAAWASPWHRPFAGGVVSLYWEASFGRWVSNRGGDQPRSAAWVTQLGITPVWRWQSGGDGAPWFVEGGIGANVLMPVYRTQDKSFSTVFNFGDHLAIGWRFGDAGRHELALRVQHFSNASIKQPNPGEDFLQLRYSRHL
jgi:lipid A 3-O-deacylase